MNGSSNYGDNGGGDIVKTQWVRKSGGFLDKRWLGQECAPTTVAPPVATGCAFECIVELKEHRHVLSLGH